MHLLIIDHSVLAYKAFMRLFSQDYEGETDDEMHEFTSQYIREVIFLKELVRPDGILFVTDCPRKEIWRHKIVRKFYGPRMNAHPVEWYPGTEERTASNACRWYVECHNTFKEVFLDADGAFKSKHMTKKNFTDWAQSDDETVDMERLKDMKVLKKMLPVVAKMYKGNREGKHFPKSAVISKDQFKDISVDLLMKIAPAFHARVAGAPLLEADDIAYAAVKRWCKHDITIATCDQDWLQLGAHIVKCAKASGVEPGEFRFWNTHKYEFADVRKNHIRKAYFEKLLKGDKSDNIESARLKGQTSGVGDKKADKIFDEVKLDDMEDWLKANTDMDTLYRNVMLVNLAEAPSDIQESAQEALRASEKHLKAVQEVELEELASEATINLATIDGQKAHQKYVLLEDPEESMVECVACEGSGISSTGKVCVPCGGAGELPEDQDED